MISPRFTKGTGVVATMLIFFLLYNQLRYNLRFLQFHQKVTNDHQRCSTLLTPTGLAQLIAWFLLTPKQLLQRKASRRIPKVHHLLLTPLVWCIEDLPRRAPKAALQAKGTHKVGMHLGCKVQKKKWGKPNQRACFLLHSVISFGILPCPSFGQGRTRFAKFYLVTTFGTLRKSTP